MSGSASMSGSGPPLPYLSPNYDFDVQHSQEYSYGGIQDTSNNPSRSTLFGPTTTTAESQNNNQPQDSTQELTQWMGSRLFPRNAHLYPASDTQLPPGLTDEDICANYPNHIEGALMLNMISRGLRIGYIYDHMPANTKRENSRYKDMNILHSAAYKANGGKALGLRASPRNSPLYPANNNPLRVASYQANGNDALGLTGFPRNSHLYPASSTPLPIGLTAEDICARYPNHLVHGSLAFDMYRRGLRLDHVYDHMPANTKRGNRDADIGLLLQCAYNPNGRIIDDTMGVERTYSGQEAGFVTQQPVGQQVVGQQTMGQPNMGSMKDKELTIIQYFGEEDRFVGEPDVEEEDAE